MIPIFNLLYLNKNYKEIISETTRLDYEEMTKEMFFATFRKERL